VKIAVVGAGAAGTGAAWALANAGADVVVVHDRAGATALHSGALDFEPWEKARAGFQPTAAEQALAHELGWVIAPCRLATNAGVLRPAEGRDRALLDLDSFAGKRVALPDFVRDDWDAELLCRSFSSSAWAQRTGTRFAPRSLDLGIEIERSSSSYDFAEELESEAVRARLVAAVDAARADVDAWLFGPWLGLTPRAVEARLAALSVPIGEVLSAPSGVAGARFEAARDLLFAAKGIAQVRTRAVALSRGASGIELELDGAPAQTVERVVLATGGVLAGGVVLVNPEPGRVLQSFALSLACDATLEQGGQSIDDVSTLYGVDFTRRGAELLEGVGVGVDGAAVRGVPGVFAAGDVVADRPRTLLSALRAGIRAAAAALG